MDRPFIVQTTFTQRDDAVAFANGVLKSRLAACVQLSNAESFYWWKENIESEPEIIVSMKTMESVYPHLEEFIEQHHPYETPEIIAIAVQRIGSGYLKWLQEELAQRS